MNNELNVGTAADSSTAAQETTSSQQQSMTKITGS